MNIHNFLLSFALVLASLCLVIFLIGGIIAIFFAFIYLQELVTLFHARY